MDQLHNKDDKNEKQNYLQNELFNYWNVRIPTTSGPEQGQAPHSTSAYLDLFDPLFGLNKEQISLLQAEHNFIAVNGGAGTGKSSLLTALTAYWIGQRKYSPGEILGLSLTENQIPQLKANLHHILGPTSQEVTITTLQALCFDLFSRTAGRSLKLFHTEERNRFLCLIFPFLEIPEIQRLSLFIEAYGWAQAPSDSEKMELTEAYLASLSKLGACDQATIVQQTYELLLREPGLLASFKIRYPAILIDDFQDISPAGYQLLGLFCNGELGGDREKKRKVIIFADLTQTTMPLPAVENPLYYKFLAEFAAHEVHFHKNYRSRAPILAAARLVAKRLNRKNPLKLNASLRKGNPLYFLNAKNEYTEVDFIVRNIKKVLEESTEELQPGDIGVVIPTGLQPCLLSAELKKADLPFYIHEARPLMRQAPLAHLLSLLNFLLNDKDILALAAVLLHVLQGFKIADIRSLFLAGNRQAESLTSLINRLYLAHQLTDNQYQQLNTFLKFTKKLKQEWKAQGIPPILQRIANHYPALGPEAYNQILEPEKLLERAAEYKKDLRGFLCSFYFSERDHELEEPDKRLHLLPGEALKGREFQILFLMGMEEGRIPGYTGNLEQEYRRLYLSLTRTSELVVMTAAAKRQGKACRPSSFTSLLSPQLVYLKNTEEPMQNSFHQGTLSELE